MDIRKAKKHYESLGRGELIQLLIKSRLEIEKIQESNDKRKIRKLSQRIRKAVAFIDSYTCKRKYITENDEELLRILELGRFGNWY